MRIPFIEIIPPNVNLHMELATFLGVNNYVPYYHRCHDHGGGGGETVPYS